MTSRNGRFPLLRAAALLWLAPATSFAAGSVTLTPANPSGSYTAGPFVNSNAAFRDQQQTCAVNAQGGCDTTALTVELPEGAAPAKRVRIAMNWSNASEDFDIYVSNSTTCFNQIASSPTTARPEVLTFAAEAGTKAYRVCVIAHTAAGGSVTVTLDLEDDSDLDGVIDDADACPGTAAGTPVGADGCLTCAAPGTIVKVDAMGEQQGAPANAQSDIHTIGFFEPRHYVGARLLGVTLKVSTLAAPAASSFWRVLFNVGSTEYHAWMLTAEAGNASPPAFRYGHLDSGFVIDGAAHASSGYKADGTISIVIPNARVGSPGDGAAITNVRAQAGTYAGTMAAPASVSARDTTPATPNGRYVTATDGHCGYFYAPVAVLAADRTSGLAALTVNFDGSQSSDQDTDETIASYTFDFGDGTAAVSQAGATVQHVYQDPGEYVATLFVTDSRGAESDVAEQAITVVAPNPPPVANAGPDFGVDEGESTALNGAASSDPESEALTFSWAQTAGPAVALRHADSVMPSFATPAISADTVLTFRLTVTDARGATSEDFVDVTVRETPPHVEASATAPATGGGGAMPALALLLLALLARLRELRVTRAFGPARALALLLALAAAPAHALPERASATAEDAVNRLRAAAGGTLRYVDSPSSAYAMVRAPRHAELFADGGAGAPEDRARLFLSLHGAALGVRDPEQQLVRQRVTRDAAGNRHVHLDQVHEGVPVLGARIVVHMNARGIYAANGVFVPNLESVDMTPAQDVATLRAAALANGAKRHPGATLQVEGGRWIVYPVGLLGGRLRGAVLSYEALVSGGPAIRERVFVDARRGVVIDHLSEVHSFLNREIYTPDQNGPPTYTEKALGTPADPPLINDPGYGSTNASNFPNNPPLDNLYIFAGGTYALYDNLFGRGGYDACDGNGPCQPDQPGPLWTPVRDTNPVVGQIQKSVYLVNNACPNAYWNGDSTNYCPGFDADDVVSHEWSHAYTQYTHGLIYRYQSGALNESYSDIYGETYDLVNDIEGPLGSLTLEEHKYYEEGGSRWVVGEDLSEEAAALLLRDMWDPDEFPAASPGKVSSPNYACGSADQGGVHTNSGVPNHAYAMLVDGKTYNNTTIPAIGMIKAAHIYFQAESQYQTPTSNFAQHAEALEASCQDLLGVDLNGLVDGLPSGQVITQADCDAVHGAMVAVEMRRKPLQCAYKPLLKPEATTPSICGDSEGAPLFSEDWEGGSIPAGWALGREAGATGAQFPNTQWTVSAALPTPHTGKAAFAFDSLEGNCTSDDRSGQFWLDTPEITLTAPNNRLVFTHFMQSEAGYDGGNVKFSVNGAAFAVVPAAAFSYNPYSGTLAPAVSDAPNTNPMAGEAAWSGTDEGELTGSWGTSIVDLEALGASTGEKVKFRWDFGQDGCNGNLGWFVDTVEVRNCPLPPVLALGPDYENPDIDGAYTLSWTRPPDAVGPDLVQESTTSCAPLFSDNGSSFTAWTRTGNDPRWEASNTKPQHAPNSAFWAIGSKGISGSANLTLNTPVAIPAGGTTTLSFLEWYINEGDDTGNVEVSSDGGTTWELVYQVNRALDREVAAEAHATEPLARRTADLTPYAGKTIRLRFRYTFGGSIYFFQDPFGWYVDDITIANANWADITTTSGVTQLIAGRTNGTRCYRVRTQFDVGGQIVPSPFSNIKTATVAINALPLAVVTGPASVNEGATATLDGTGSSDPEGQALTYAWSQVSGPAVTFSTPAGASTDFTAPSVPADATLVLRLTVRDGAGLQASDDITIDLVNVNIPPVANAGADFPVDEGAAVLLSGDDSQDADGEPLGYAWDQVAGPTVALTDEDTATPSFTAPYVGADRALTFRLSVTDPYGATSFDEVTVLVRNVPPVAPVLSADNRVGGGLDRAALLVLTLLALARRRRAARAAR